MNKRNVNRALSQTLDEVYDTYLAERKRNNLRGKVTYRETQLLEMSQTLARTLGILSNLQKSESTQNQFVNPRTKG